MAKPSDRCRIARIMMLSLALGVPWNAHAAAPDVGTTPHAEAADGNLHDIMMKKFEAMNATQQGIFREDVTASAAPFFPVGQRMAETQRILAQQKLGALQPFMGTNDPGMGTMYVTHFDLTSHMYSRVYVVLDFDFEGSGETGTLKQMKAFIRASNM